MATLFGRIIAESNAQGAVGQVNIGSVQMLKVISTAALIAFAASAEARVYTCDSNGRKVYQSTPCEAGDKPINLYVPAATATHHTPPPTSQSEYLEQMREKERARQEIINERADKARASREEREAIADAIRKREVMIGMNEQQVIQSWGKPDDINRSVYKWGVEEQWVYRRGDYDAQYVYFENGIVDAIN